MKITANTITTAIREQELAAGLAAATEASFQSQLDQLIGRIAKNPESSTTRAGVDNMIEVAAMAYENLSREAIADEELAHNLKGYNAAEPEKWRNARLSGLRTQLARAAVANELTHKPSPKATKRDKVVIGYSVEWKEIAQAEDDPLLEQFNDCVTEFRKAYKAGSIKESIECNAALAAAAEAMIKALAGIAATEADKGFDEVEEFVNKVTTMAANA